MAGARKPAMPKGKKPALMIVIMGKKPSDGAKAAAANRKVRRGATKR